MTEKELRSLEKVGPEEAARYIGNKMNAQYIRLWAQEGTCPFCKALRRTPESRRYVYFINIEALIKYKNGEIISNTA